VTPSLITIKRHRARDYMFYSKHNFAVSQFCSTSSPRPELAGILVAPDKTAASDSFVLVEVSSPTGYPEKDFPKLPGHKLKVNNKESFIFPAKAAKEVERSIPKKMAALPILERAAVIKTQPHSAGFITTDLKTSHPVIAKTIEGEYPAYEQLFTEDEPQSVVTVNPMYLKKLGAFFSNFSSAGRVKIKIYGSKSAILFEAENDAQKARALLMPMVDPD